MPRYLHYFFVTSLGLWLLCFTLIGKTAPVTVEEKQQYIHLLRQVEYNKAEILASIAKMDITPNIIWAKQQFSQFWQSEKIKKQFEQHYKEVERALQEVVIDDQYSAWDVVKSQYQAVLPFKSKTDQLKTISRQFIQSSIEVIQPLQDKFIQQLILQFEIYVNRIFIQTQQNIGKELDAIIIRNFNYWPKFYTALAHLSVNKEQLLTGSLDTLSVEKKGMAGTTGIILLLARKRITRLISRKIMGKVASKVIAPLALISIAYEIYDASTIKKKMQKMLRSSFFKTYQQLLQPQKIGNSLQEKLEKSLQTAINQWFTKTKEDMVQFLEDALFFNNKSFQEYGLQRIKEGASLISIANELMYIKNTFGYLASKVPINLLYEIKVSVPTTADSKFLARLVTQFDMDMIVWYQKYGNFFLQAASDMGVKNTYTLIQDNYDLFDVHAVFIRVLGNNAKQSAKNGFFILYRVHTAIEPYWEVESFSAINANTALFSFLLECDIEWKKIATIFSSKPLLEIVDLFYQQDPYWTKKLLQNFSIKDITHYYSVNKNIHILKKVYALQYMEVNDETVNQYLQQIKTKQTVFNIYHRYGEEGLHILAAYPEKGTLHQARLKKALYLYEQGYDIDICRDPKAVEFATALLPYPFAKVVFSFIYPFLPLLSLLVWGGIVMIFIWMISKLRRKKILPGSHYIIVDKNHKMESTDGLSNRATVTKTPEIIHSGDITR